MLSRSALASRNAALLRAQARRNARLLGRRLNSTAPPPGGQSANVNHSTGGGMVPSLIAGALGGGTVLVGVYGYYHWSGAAQVVQSAKSMRDSALQARDQALEKVPSTSEALDYLRKTAQAYAVFIPGGKQYVDTTFDTLEEARQTHGQEVDQIVKGTYDEIKKVVDAGSADFDTAQKVAGILAKRGKELAKVAQKASGDLLDKYPGAKDKLGAAYSQLESFAKGRGEEGKKALQEVRQQLGEMFQKGGASTDEVIAKAKEVLSSKQADLKGAGDKAWQAGMDQAKPYLDKVPELRKALEQNKDALAAAVSGGSADVWDRVKKVAEAGKKDQGKAVEEFKQWAKEKGEEAKQGGEEGWDKLEDLIKQIPGGQTKYTEAFKKKAPEAQKVAEEALNDIINVLKEKGKKIEELGKETKDEAQKK
ncbi:hypothetical protein CALCODRAFT_337705 [Calocera cornea HHB12733]|uniref:Uncharacterized protein n=1 Tax=Calocera cornea HHB12733 TaxID=1353952 RepID=A0A165EZC8_9BASI|nr:hypothetical protein CALCODRAFT_337705 [Calocera cornea HHB12733]